MKRKPTNTKKPIKPDPAWQTDYKRYGNFRFHIPRQLLMLCRLMRVTPQQLLGDFIDRLSCTTSSHKTRDTANDYLINYFLDQGYGEKRYSRQEILAIFKEMDAVGSLFPSGGDEKIVQVHLRWREQYWHYWFNKWLNKLPDR